MEQNKESFQVATDEEIDKDVADKGEIRIPIIHYEKNGWRDKVATDFTLIEKGGKKNTIPNLMLYHAHNINKGW